MIINAIIVHLFMKSGYFGLSTIPKGDLSLACSALEGLRGFNLSWISFKCYFYLSEGGSDFPFIISNFSLLNTYFWMFLWVDNGK